MDRKTILIIFLAGIFALVGAFVILKPNNTTPRILPEQKEEIVPISEPEVIEEVVTESEAKPETKPEVKPAITQPVKKVSYKKPTPQSKEIEEPVIKPILVKEAVPEPLQNEGVVQEVETTDIVITKEYKVKSPSRYSFK